MNVYPGAKLHLLTVGDPSDPTVHGTPGDLNDKNTVVLHITDGHSAASAIATFEAPKKPHRVSAHFVIDRDGTVYQLMDPANIAWHASQCNTHGIGIEHVGWGPPDGACTDAQHAASA